MAMFVSRLSRDVQSLPEAYVFPPDKRPGELVAPEFNNPIIDFSKPVDETIPKILRAGQEFGFFQAINHGISQSLMDEAMVVLQEFFELPPEVKERVFTTDPGKKCRLYSSTLNYETENVHLWRDNLTHPCHPLEEYLQLWPEKPTRYREIVGEYSAEVRNLVLRIFDLICKGLGLEQGYFGNELSGTQLLSVNHYPRCPDPNLALGFYAHRDPNTITILSQGDIYGLQFLKDGEWIGVEPLPNAFVVIIGCQLQIVSNDKLRSAEHRVVTNTEVDRTSIGYFVLPFDDYFVEPAKDLVDDWNPPIYKACQYTEFLSSSVEKKGDYAAVMESNKLQQA
jgi:isopenicillin N synthase-like dioxygenase